MRKYVSLTVALLVLCAVSAQAQDLKSILGGIAKTVVGDVTTTQTSIIGTWNYVSPAIKMQSDNTLASLGGDVASSTVESKLAPMYAKIGLDKCVFTFNEDGTYTTSMGKIKSSGTYTFDAESKIMTMKTKLGATVTAEVTTTITSMTLVFKADKVMSAVKTITGYLGNVTKYANTVNALAKNYDGMSLGFELVKQ